MRRWLVIHVPIALVVLFLLGFREQIPFLQPAPTATPTATASNTATVTLTPSLTPTASATSTPTRTATPTRTPTLTQTATITQTPTITPTPTATPTYAPIAAIVLQQSNCRYGPGAAYLYEWGLYPDVRVDILGRNDLGTWVYVHPWTYFENCWVNASLLEIRGDVMDAPEYYGRLPYSDLYRPPSNVSATRDGNDVVVFWDPIPMTLDDDRGYLLETWVCRDGQLIFTPVHVDYPPAVIEDQPGCLQPSSGRLYTAEKHGYTQWVLIPWPAYPTNTPPPPSDTQ